MTPEDISELAEHVADTWWLSAFADAVERAIDDGDETARELHPGPGGDWADMPYHPVPEGVYRFALDRLARIGSGILREAWEAWRDASGLGLERFGHCLAMSSLGHGIGLTDDVYPVPAAVEVLAARKGLVECVGFYSDGKVDFDYIG